MQLTRVAIANFKGVREFAHDWTRAWDGRPRPLTLLLGDNGSGKTSILQAIGLVLSLASGKTSEVARFKWQGFLPRRLGTFGPTRIELDLRFEPEELAATKDAFVAWLRRAPADEVRRLVPPGDLAAVTLRYEEGVLSSPQGPAALSQFLGRSFVRKLLDFDPRARQDFARIGDVFWFDQHRNLASVDELRQYLVRWWSHHTSPRSDKTRDYLARLERLMQRVFPGFTFIGTENLEGAFDLSEVWQYVLIERAGHVYDISEMSSGEQAVFPLMYEAARLDIARSVVLIDELELHLHPPEQQTLLVALREIGAGNQFIVTSHSPYLEEVTPDDDEIRLEGGLRCL